MDPQIKYRNWSRVDIIDVVAKLTKKNEILNNRLREHYKTIETLRCEDRRLKQ